MRTATVIRAAICDDEPTILDYLHEHISKEFKQQGAEIQMDKFTSGKEFLNVHEEELFDLVFLDIDMPEISGFDVAEEISESEYTIIIFVTTHDEIVFSSLKFQPLFSIIAVCLVVIVSGCERSNENKMNYSSFYADDDLCGDHRIAERIVSKTEFPEYSESVQNIKVTIENNSDEVFYVIGNLFTLQQLCDGKWKHLNFIGFTTGSMWLPIKPGKT